MNESNTQLVAQALKKIAAGFTDLAAALEGQLEANRLSIEHKRELEKPSVVEKAEEPVQDQPTASDDDFPSEAPKLDIPCSKQDLAQLCMLIAKKHGPDRVMQILASIGIQKISAVKEEELKKVYKALSKAYQGE